MLPHALHYALGAIALLALLAALVARKGSKAHIVSGRIFVVGMMIAAVTAYYFVFVSFDIPPVFDATLFVVAAGTAVLALQPPGKWIRRAELLLTVVTFVAAAMLILVGSMLLRSGAGLSAVPAAVHGAIFAALFFEDLSFRKSTERDKRKVRRHLFRMSWAVAIGVYAPLFTFRDSVGLSSEAVYFGAMALGPLTMLTFWKTASRLDRGVSSRSRRRRRSRAR